jgi:hypothetical protein
MFFYHFSIFKFQVKEPDYLPLMYLQVFYFFNFIEKVSSFIYAYCSIIVFAVFIDFMLHVIVIVVFTIKSSNH